jgi:Anti-sigma factor NepR
LVCVQQSSVSLGTLGVRSMTKSRPVDDTTLNRTALDQKVLDAIGGALKAHYDALVYTPLPEKVLDLLARLEEEEEREQPRGKPDA